MPGVFWNAGLTGAMCGSAVPCVPSSSVANLVESISNVSLFVFPLSQQNMVRKENLVPELDVNQMEGGSQEISVQITGQIFSDSLKSS